MKQSVHSNAIPNCQIIKVAIIKILHKYDTALSSLTYLFYYTQFEPNAIQNRQVITNCIMPLMYWL